MQALEENNLMVETRHDGDVAGVGKDDVELGEQAGLRRVKVTDYILVTLLLDKLKDSELFRLA